MPIPAGIAEAFPWMVGTKEIQASAFIWNEWQGDNSFLGNFDETGCAVRKPEGWNVLGWCDGGKLTVRPRPGMLAVMFEDESGERFWCHIV